MYDLQHLTEGNRVNIDTHQALRLFNLESLIKIVLHNIDKSLHRKQINLQIGDQYYALNDMTRLRLLDLINGQIVEEQEHMNSDTELVYKLRALKISVY